MTSTTSAIDTPTITRQPPRAAAPSAGVSQLRLTWVELRKLGDTRAGLWLLIIIGVCMAATVAILLAAGAPAEQRFSEFLGFSLLPAGVLLPVLGILSMTSEWSQRTALTTFALVPVRGRVILAKLTAAVLIALLSAVVSVACAAVGNLLAIAMDGDGSWSVEARTVGQIALAQVIFVLMGSAFGALLLNSPLAIVLYFVVPTLWSALGEMVRWLRDAAQWLDLNVTSMALTDPNMTSGQWARLGTSVAVWVLLPLAAGTVRVLRREVS